MKREIFYRCPECGEKVVGGHGGPCMVCLPALMAERWPDEADVLTFEPWAL